jgi:hypothetical protein
VKSANVIAAFKSDNVLQDMSHCFAWTPFNLRCGRGNRRRGSNDSDRFAFGQTEIAPAIVALVNLVWSRKCGDLSDGNAQMTFTANSIAGEGDAFLAALRKTVIVRQNERGHFRAEFLDSGLGSAGSPGGIELELLQLDQAIHSLTHGFLNACAVPRRDHTFQVTVRERLSLLRESFTPFQPRIHFAILCIVCTANVMVVQDKIATANQ